MKEWIQTVLDQFGALGVALLMLIENVFPPIPSEVVMPWAGYSVQQGNASFVVMVIAGSLGSFAGATFWYVIAKWIGKQRLSDWVERHGWWITISKQDIDRTDRWFERWGGVAVLVCRVIPGLRTLISVPAGFAEMSWTRFSIYTLIGTVAWTTILAAIGWWLADNYGDLAGPLSWVSTLVVAGLFLWWLARFISQYVSRHGHAGN